MNIYEPFCFWAKASPTRPALAFPGGAISYGQLHSAASDAVSEIRRAGFSQRDIVDVLILNPAFQMIVLTALGLAGITANVVAMPRNTSKGFITDNPQAKGVGRRLVLDHKWFVAKLSAPSATLVPPAHCAPDHIVRLVATSGTTADPRLIAITHRMMQLRLDSCPYMPSSERALSLLLPHGSWGYLAAMKLLAHGGTFCFAPYPEDALDLAETWNCAAICVSPDQLASLVHVQKERRRELAGLRYILVGGASSSPSLLAEAQQLLCQNIVIGYGASEAGHVASAPMSRMTSAEGGAGWAHPNIAIQIADENNRPVPIGQSGRIRIKGDTVTAGYHQAEPGADSAFVDGWFYPGDIGSVGSDGVLCVLGRSSELIINKGGFKLNPVLIEDKVRSFAGVIELAVTEGQSDEGAPQLWLAIVSAPGFDMSAFEKYSASTLGPLDPERKFVIASLPKTADGKIKRAELSANLRGLAAAHPAKH